MRFNKIFSSIVISSLMALIATPAHAAMMWASSIENASQGLMKNGQPVPAIRSNLAAVLGQAEETIADGTFYSLGFGGYVTLAFPECILPGTSSGVTVIEATHQGYPKEYARVEMSADNSTWYTAGVIGQSGMVGVPAQLTAARYVRITDVSEANDFPDEIADGYDVDGVTVFNFGPCPSQPTPTPTPSSSPNPQNGKHTNLGKNGPSCDEKSIQLTFDTKENGEVREGIEVTFEYKGEKHVAKTNNSGRASASYVYRGAGSVTADAAGDYPDQSLHIDELANCPTSQSGTGGEARFGSTTYPAPVLGASTTTLADTGMWDSYAQIALRVMFGFILGLGVYMMVRWVYRRLW